MSAVLQRLSCFSESVRPNRRKAARALASAHVTVSAAQGQSASAVLADVSTHGCNILCDAEWLKAGRFIAIQLEAGEPIQAVVRWERDGSVGLEFLRPVHGSRSDWHDLIDSPWGA